METPKNTRVPGTTRNPTPRLSERKKSLFASKEEAQRDLFEGIAPLEDESVKSDCPDASERYAKSRRSIKSLLILNEQPKSLRFLSDHDQLDKSTSAENTSPSRRSLRLNPKTIIVTTPPSRRSPRHSINVKSPMRKIEQGKENIPVSMEPEEQLQLLFDSSMKLDCSSNALADKSSEIVAAARSAIELSNAVDLHKVKDICKRSNDSTSPTSNTSPQRKIRRLEGDTLTPGKMYISTKSFYSNVKTSPTTVKPLVSPTTRLLATTSPKLQRTQRRGVDSINKGVKHKIRRRPKTSATYRSVHIDNILNNLRNEKLRQLITSNREQKAQIDKIHRIFRCGQNPIEVARPLSAISDDIDYTNNNNINKTREKTSKNSSNTSLLSADIEFSDIECDSEDDDSNIDDDNVSAANLTKEIVPLLTHQSPQTLTKSDELGCSSIKKRKFFKSGHTTNTRKEVTITENIKASVFNGKISLVENKKRTKRRIKLKRSRKLLFFI